MNDVVSDEIRRYIDSTRKVIDSIRVTSPEGSLNRRLSDSYMEMIECYCNDAVHFVASGELVTAFAATSYIYGWVDCGARVGLFDIENSDRHFDLYRERLNLEVMMGVVTDAKIERYLDISKRAMDKISPVSPARSFNKRLTESFSETIDTRYAEAVKLKESGDNTSAFATVNYAHGWIDCGARIGIFDVNGDDQLFTLYE